MDLAAFLIPVAEKEAQAQPLTETQSPIPAPKNLYEAYIQRQYLGIDFNSNPSFNQAANQAKKQDEYNLKLKKLSGENEFKALTHLNNAFENMNNIIANSDETSGFLNNKSRQLANFTGNIWQGSYENQDRINDEALLKANYQNAIAIKSGGTAKERAEFNKAIDFGNLDAKGTRAKAIHLYGNFIDRQQNLLAQLEAKGYDYNLIIEAMGGENNFKNNILAYEYLKNNAGNFNKNEFESVYKYGQFFEKEQKIKMQRAKK